jgi:CheY-like chemotaxis protein/nitrogen-specific signal transduction histidine kinase
MPCGDSPSGRRHGVCCTRRTMDPRADLEEARHLREELKRERLARIAAERTNRLNDELMRSLAHKLRNPLNTIRLWTQVLREQAGEPAVVARALDGLEHATLLQARQIDTLLDLSRIALGRMRLDLEPVDLAAIVRSAVEAVRPMTQAKRLSIETDLGMPVGVISGDPARLGQVLWHLLTNAIRFTPHGGRVGVTLRRSGDRAMLSIADSGHGIAPDLLPHVFDRDRPEGSRVPPVEDGPGLGLVLARYIVELHGGTIRAESDGEGRGSTFTLELPLPGTTVPAVSREDVTGSIDGTGGGSRGLRASSLIGVRVLVVEDEPEARDSLRILLQRFGAEVAAAGSARQAIETFTHGAFDIVISDIAMPGGDGYELVRAIRGLGAEHGGRIPAVAVTAGARPEDRRRALAEGFQVHLPKPVDAVELVRQVTVLSGR